jgi:GNAT superfamily N-acetyltransferase
LADLEFVNLGADDYERAKTILNKAKHPGFVGRELFYRCATTGVVCVATLDGMDLGVAMIAKEKLQALSIISAGQGKGVGTALMRRLQPKWVSAIAERISFFERCGYKAFGAPKVGQNGKHATQLMERGEMPAAGETAANDASRIEREKEPDAPPPTLLLDMSDEPKLTRHRAELAVLDDMLAKARAADQNKDVLAILERAEYISNQIDRLNPK